MTALTAVRSADGEVEWKFREMLEGMLRVLREEEWIHEFPSPEELREHIHGLRRWEYPWATMVCPPEGRILDIGSNPQFPLMLLGMGCSGITLHHTEYDLEHLTEIFFHYNSGWRSIRKTYRREHERLNLVVGYPGNWPIAPATFDTIYNISVMEHVPPDQVMVWMEEIWRVLKPGGRLCCTFDWPTRNPGPGFWPHDFGEFASGSDVVVEQGEEIPWLMGEEGWREIPGLLLGSCQAEEDRREVELGVYGCVFRKLGG